MSSYVCVTVGKQRDRMTQDELPGEGGGAGKGGIVHTDTVFIACIVGDLIATIVCHLAHHQSLPHILHTDHL